MKVIRAINRFFTWVCMALIVALMLLMVAEVLRRAIFNRAILGSTEWAQVLLVCNMTAFGASVLSNRQIKVDMLTKSLPVKVQVVLDIVTLTMAFATITVLAWQQFNFAIKSYQTHIGYINITLPQWPFVALFAFGYAVAALTTLSLIVRKIVSICKGDWEKEHRLEELDEIFVGGSSAWGQSEAPAEAAETEAEKGGADNEP